MPVVGLWIIILFVEPIKLKAIQPIRIRQQARILFELIGLMLLPVGFIIPKVRQLDIQIF